MPQSSTITKLAEVFNVESKELFEFYHLNSVQELRKDLNKIISELDDEKIILTYKYVKTFVM